MQTSCSTRMRGLMAAFLQPSGELEWSGSAHESRLFGGLDRTGPKECKSNAFNIESGLWVGRTSQSYRDCMRRAAPFFGPV